MRQCSLVTCKSVSCGMKTNTGKKDATSITKNHRWHQRGGLNNKHVFLTLMKAA